MQRFRSCLALSIKIFLPFYLLLFGCMTYAHLRMWWVNYQIFQVAEQLGYTPDALLRHEVDTRDWGFLLDTNCDAHLYYTTTLSPAEFGERVKQVLPEIFEGSPQPLFTSSLSIPGLHIKGVDAEALLLRPVSEEEKLNSYHWFIIRSRNDISLELYETANLRASLDYKGMPITGNIVELYKFGGAFQIWNCPVMLRENRHLPPR